MRLKLLLIALFLSSGCLPSFARVQLPKVEVIQDALETTSDLWVGHTFSEILPPQNIKQILLFEDAVIQIPSARETQSFYTQLFHRLEHSDRKMERPFEYAYEMPCAEFAVITSSGDIFRVEALRGKGIPVLISGHGISARLDTEGFNPTTATNQPLVADLLLPEVEISHLLYKQPDDWTGKRFKRIIPAKTIKRILVLNQIDDLLDYVHTVPTADKQHERQMLYENLFDHFEASNLKAGTNSITRDFIKNELVLAELILITDSDEVIFLEIIGVPKRVENGAVFDKHITGILIQGPGKGARINLLMNQKTM